MRCLDHRSDTRVAYEVVIADDGSPTRRGPAWHDRERSVHRAADQSWLPEELHVASATCRGRYALLFNNDAQLLPGALDALVEALVQSRRRGSSPKFLYPNGRLQEAGCAVDRTA
jgi:hypothetical protein